LTLFRRVKTLFATRTEREAYIAISMDMTPSPEYR
jgi:hypothetical protein